ncbi:DegT/DnrJ/EryC1/StrS family aminotransferase, partial [Vibrio parahaemolyticus]|uniref:DegT/DnrJ/EryC1/StrS family aminotransferase n=1 Tax=Vibrio parahaemolyticus TaxID=670 RepID=UPI00146E6678
LQIWRTYLDELTPVATKHNIEVPTVPFECQHNAHMFYLKLRNLEQRSKFIEMLRDEGVMSVFHYIPLHSSPAGQEFGRFVSSDNYTTQESERLVRLPLFFNMTDVELSFVIKAIKNVLGR